MTRIRWRWQERDFGFRFRTGRGRRSAEHYQTASAGEFYVIAPGQRKLSTARMEELAAAATIPTGPKIVANPWKFYERDWDWIESDHGICLNYAGCLDKEEIDRREDEGVARAREYVLGLLERPEPVPVTVELIQQIHLELMGEIYPFAGRWRTVELTKGEGPVKWPLPAIGTIADLIAQFEKDVLVRTPFLNESADEIFLFLSELMNEFLVIHPFREGNGRTAFILADLILMQNDMLPLSEYDANRHQAAYYAACEAGRVQANYEPLRRLLTEWEDAAIARWGNENE